MVNAKPEWHIPFCNVNGAAFGDFYLLRRVGQGGMAEVFLAQRSGPQGFQKQLVIKRLLPQHAKCPIYTELFLKEARVSALVEHPNVAHVSDFGDVDGQYYIAMEYVDGLTLSEVIDVVGPLPVGVGCRIVIDVLDALESIHTTRDLDGQPLHLVHRDLSPRNVMITRGGAVKLLDFGIAISADDRNPLSAGTRSYMAPEQARGDPVDHRADLYSAGLLLAVATKGRSGFELTKPDTLAHGIPPSLYLIIRRALAIQPKDRFQTAHEFEAALEAFVPECGEEGTKAHLGQLASFVVPPMTFMGRVRTGNALLEQTHAFPSTGAEQPQESTLSGPAQIGRWPKLAVAMGLLMAVVWVLVSITKAPPASSETRTVTHQIASPPAAAENSVPAPTQGDDPAKVGSAVAPDPPVHRTEMSGPPRPSRLPTAASGPPEASPTGIKKAPSRNPRPAPSRNPRPARSPPRKTREQRAHTRAAHPGRMSTKERTPSQKRAGIGFLSIDTVPWTQVFVNGRSIGVTPLARIKLPSGTHTLRLLNEGHRIDDSTEIHIVSTRVLAIRKRF